MGPITVRVTLDGRELAADTFSRAGWETVSWDIPPAEPGTAGVTITSSPPFKPRNDPRTLGIAVGGFGFAAERK